MNKDWNGNKKSVFATLGASNHSDGERETHDFYASDPVSIYKLAAKFDIPHKVWECACGMGHLSEKLKALGSDVFSTDLVDRGYGEVMDFLSWDADKYKGKFDCILTNPPYKYVTEFVLKSLSLLNDGGYAIFLLKTTALESRGRYENIYRNTPPHYVFQFVDRLLCAKNGDFEGSKKNLGAGAQAYAWFVFEKGYKGNTILDWI